MYVSDCEIKSEDPFLKIAFMDMKWEKLKSILKGLEWRGDYYLVLSRFYSIRYDKNSEKGSNFDYDFLNNCYGKKITFTVDDLDSKIRNGLYLCHGLLVFCRKKEN